MSDNFPKYGATLLNAVGLSRFEVTFDGDCIYSSDDASMDDGLLRYIAQLREQLAKAEAEAKRYREALQSIVDQWICRSELFTNDRDIAENIVATARIALIPHDEQGTTHD